MSEKKLRQKLYVYDVFDGFLYPEARTSLDDTWFGGHVSDGLEVVTKRVKRRHKKPEMVRLYRRNICEPNALREVQKISFANIDVDMYEAVYAALHEAKNW